MLAQAIAQEGPVRTQESELRDIFVQLIERYEPALRRLVGGYAEQAADREDLFQEIAIGVWQAIPRFRGDSSERTWLYRIAHNIAISASTRRRRRARREEPIAEQLDYRSESADSEQAMLRSEKQMLLLRAIRTLPEPDRQIVLLHLEGLSYAQIEEISGVSQSAIGSRLSRLRDSLREQIQAKGRGGDEL